MRLVAFEKDGGSALALRRGDDLIDLSVAAPDLPADLGAILAAGALERVGAAADGAGADALVERAVTYLPPIARPGKIICVGLNYVDHASESPYEKPDYPVLFLRVATTLVGHDQPMIRPRCSE